MTERAVETGDAQRLFHPRLELAEHQAPTRAGQAAGESEQDAQSRAGDLGHGAQADDEVAGALLLFVEAALLELDRAVDVELSFELEHQGGILLARRVRFMAR